MITVTGNFPPLQVSEVGMVQCSASSKEGRHFLLESGASAQCAVNTPCFMLVRGGFLTVAGYVPTF